MNNDRRKALNALIGQIEEANSTLENIRDEIDSLKGEEEDGFNNLPEGLQQGERGQAMEEATNAMQEAYDALDAASASACEAIDAINNAVGG